MKKFYSIIALLSFSLFIFNCKGKQQENESTEKLIFQIDSVEVNTGVQRMQVSNINQEITCKGKKYQLTINRRPADDLPSVKSEMGTFAENRIRVKILRENGTNLFSKEFVKSDFAAHLTTDYLSHSILEGLVFDDVKTLENQQITLAASVSYPMTDLYIPFTIVITQDGKMALSKDEDMGELTPLDE